MSDPQRCLAWCWRVSGVRLDSAAAVLYGGAHTADRGRARGRSRCGSYSCGASAASEVARDCAHAAGRNEFHGTLRFTSEGAR
jgi:hypothetical protein